jgi:hypothetical protein
MESDAVREDVKPEAREIARVGAGPLTLPRPKGPRFSCQRLFHPTTNPRRYARRDPVEDRVPHSN